MVHLSTDLNPKFLAGASADEEEELSPRLAVAELGIGNAEGFTRSVKTILREWGAPSYTLRQRLPPHLPSDHQLTSAVASIWTRPPILPTLTLKVKEL